MTERKKTKRVKTIGKMLGTPKKPDVFSNSEGLCEVIAAQAKKEAAQKKYPLRINKQTVIFVSKEKCNEAYAERYRQKISGQEVTK